MYYENLLIELFFVVAVIGISVGIILTAAYWFLRTLVAGIGQEAKRAGKSIKKWAETN